MIAVLGVLAIGIVTHAPGAFYLSWNPAVQFLGAALIVVSMIWGIIWAGIRLWHKRQVKELAGQITPHITELGHRLDKQDLILATVDAEIRTNGGSSLKDSVNRIEANQEVDRLTLTAKQIEIRDVLIAQQIVIKQDLTTAQNRIKEDLITAQGEIKEDLTAAQEEIKEDLLASQQEIKEELDSNQAWAEKTLEKVGSDIVQVKVDQAKHLGVHEGMLMKKDA